MNFKAEKLVEVPQVGDRISGPATEARAIVVRGVHRGALREQELCSLDRAAPHCPVEGCFASAAFPGPSAAVASADNGADAEEAGLFRAKNIH